jgi:hypothetical protein
MKAFSKYAFVIVDSLVTGAALFVSSFVAVDFIWTHFVVPNPRDIGLGDGVVVVGGGFIIGSHWSELCSAPVRGWLNPTHDWRAMWTRKSIKNSRRGKVARMAIALDPILPTPTLPWRHSSVCLINSRKKNPDSNAP